MSFDDSERLERMNIFPIRVLNTRICVIEHEDNVLLSCATCYARLVTIYGYFHYHDVGRRGKVTEHSHGCVQRFERGGCSGVSNAI